MFDSPVILLVLLLVGSWVGVFTVRALMGKSFKSKDHLARDEALIAAQMQNKQQSYLNRSADDSKIIKEMEEDQEQAAQGEHIYPTHKTKEEHIKEEYKVGKEKETTYPER